MSACCYQRTLGNAHRQSMRFHTHSHAHLMVTKAERCNNDTILQLQVLLLIMPEILTGPKAGRSTAAIQQVYTTGSPFCQ